MSETTIRLPLDTGNTGKLMRALQLNVGGLSTLQEVISIGNPTTSDLAVVDSTGHLSTVNDSIGATGSSLPVSATYLGGNKSGTFTGVTLDSSGNLNVNLAAGSISGGNLAASLTGSAVPTNADYLGVNISGTLVGLTGISLTNAKAATVAIVDGSGNQITSFGGGTQYADSAASGATPTGTLSMGWDSVNSKVRALKVDTSQNLLVDVANSSIAVTGTFWQTTQPVSLASLPSLAAGSALVGGVEIFDGAGTNKLAVNASGQIAVSNFPATQSVLVSNFPAVQQISNTPNDIFLTGLVDTDGNIVGITDNALDVHIKQEDPVNISDSYGNVIRSVNGALSVIPVGTTPVSLSAPLATVPALLSAIYLQDASQIVWQITINNSGQLITNTDSGGHVPQTLFLNGPSTSWTVGITTSGFIQATSTAFSSSYPTTLTLLSSNSTPFLLSILDNGALVTQALVTFTNLSQFGGSAVVTGTGLSGAGIPRVTVSSDSFPSTQTVGGSVSVSNFPSVQPVTDTLPVPDFLQQIINALDVLNYNICQIVGTYTDRYDIQNSTLVT